MSATTVGNDTLTKSASASLDHLLEQHHVACHAWAMSCCRGDRAEAEDVLQSSYLKVLDGRAVFGSRSSFKSWLFGVIRHTAAEHRRRRLLRRLWGARPLEGLQLADPAADSDAALVRSESTMRLTSALATLPRRQQDLMHLVFYQDLSIREAAGVLGISIGSARTHYERGKKRLRQLLIPRSE